MNEKKYKTELCRYYKSPKGCDKGNKCSFIHNEKEIINYKKKCISGVKCYKKECLFLHPEDWNYKNNIKICEFFKNGYCINEDNCEFKHIKKNEMEINNNDNIKIKENINISNNDEFPELKENNEISNIIKINKDVFKNETNDQDNIQYSEVNKDEKISSPNIEIIVNGLGYNDKDDMLNINEDISKSNNVEDLINKLQYDFLEFSKKIKTNIDKTFIEDKYIYGINMKLELNKIISEIDLFKNNYQDIIMKDNKNS